MWPVKGISSFHIEAEVQTTEGFIIEIKRKAT